MTTEVPSVTSISMYHSLLPLRMTTSFPSPFFVTSTRSSSLDGDDATAGGMVGSAPVLVAAQQQRVQSDPMAVPSSLRRASITKSFLWFGRWTGHRTEPRWLGDHASVRCQGPGAGPGPAAVLAGVSAARPVGLPGPVGGGGDSQCPGRRTATRFPG